MSCRRQSPDAARDATDSIVCKSPLVFEEERERERERETQRERGGKTSAVVSRYL